MPRGRPIIWTPEMEILLGAASDRRVAEQLGLSHGAICNHRLELDLSSYTKRTGGPIKWTLEMDALLGKLKDKEVATRLRISRRTVHLRREELDIPSWQSERETRPEDWLPEMETLLGNYTDKEVAELLGLAKCAARKHRRRLGIPSWREQHRVIPGDMSAWSSEAGKIYAARARSKKRELPNDLTYEQWQFACEWFDHCCAYCGKKAFLTEDHLIPASKGGPRTALNIIPACWECNYSKRAKRAHLWIYEKFGMKKGEEVVERIVTYLTEVSSQWT